MKEFFGYDQIECRCSAPQCTTDEGNTSVDAEKHEGRESESVRRGV